ncbi:MAG: prepilin-type N-terminal cleavage/methylation domain-containing protein [Gemmatimonadetes bacterium]|nr:prepilin-type N-terminal cleavage/methylation domain-containing protein [Gemmatimonadota bacterium]
MTRNRRTGRRRGFSLVEMLVVVGIVGVITGLVTPAVLSVRHSAIVNAAMTDLRAMDVAINSDCARIGKCGDYRFRGIQPINRSVPDMLKQFLPSGFKFKQDTNTYAMEIETYIFFGGVNPLYPMCFASCQNALLQPTWTNDNLGFTNSAGFMTPNTIYVSLSVVTRSADVAQSLYTRIGGSPPVYDSSTNIWKVTYPVLVGVPATG